MTVDDQTRLRLHRRLEEVLGADEANTLMAQLPPVGWRDVATKQDLEVLGARLSTELRGELGQLRGELGELRGELRGELGDLRVGLFELRGEMYKALHRQTWTTIGTFAAFNAALAGFLTLVIALTG
jgi:hypothetical protein